MRSARERRWFRLELKFIIISSPLITDAVLVCIPYVRHKGRFTFVQFNYFKRRKDETRSPVIFFRCWLVFSMLLTACGGGPQRKHLPRPKRPPQKLQQQRKHPRTEAPGATEAPATEAPAGTVECPAGVDGMAIEMWSPFTGPDGDEMTALAERFSSENTCGITVTHVAQPEYQQKLEAAAAAGGLPAMTAVHATRIAALVSRNVLKPFGPEAMAVFGDDFGGEFPEELWSVGEIKGERYSIPLDVHPLIMFYNKDLFAAAGIEEPGTEPWTSAEFEDALGQA